MSQVYSQKQNSEAVIVFLMAAICALVLPILIISYLFAYFIWVSFRFYDKRKWIRSIFIYLIGGFLSFTTWVSCIRIAVNYLRRPEVQWSAKEKTIQIITNKYFIYVFGAYFLITIICVFIIDKKSPRSSWFYEKTRQAFFKLFFPVRIVHSYALAFMAGVVKTIGLDVKRPSISFWFFAFFAWLITVCVLFGFLMFATEKLGINTQFRYFLESAVVSFSLCYMYSFIFHSGDVEVEVFNAVTATNQVDGLFVGRLYDPKKIDLRLTWRDINHHIHILGQPGSGKSVLLKNIYLNQIAGGHGLLMIDLKADYKVREDFKIVCSMYQREQDLIIIDLSNPDKSYGYNPLLFGNASEIKDKIIGSFEWSEVHYKKISERVLLTALSGLVWFRDKQKLMPTMEDLYFSISSVQGLNLLAEKIEDERIKQNIYALASEYTKDFVQGIEGIKTDIALLIQAEFGSIFSKSTALNVYEAIQNKKVILVNLDGQTYSESAKVFGRLILSDLRSASGSIVTNLSEEARPQFTVIIDEFADIVSNEDMARTFVGFLNRCRGSGIGVIIAHQSLGDFKDPTVKSQVIDSTETMFSFVQKDPDTCETLASIVGTKLVFEKTMQTENGLFGDGETGMGTKKEVHEFIYHPNVFRSLGVGHAVYIAKKPTRFGILQINMINLEKQNTDVFESLTYVDQNFDMLDLKGINQNRKKQFINAVKSSKSDDDSDPVDI